jgi:O-antigen ligase
VSRRVPGVYLAGTVGLAAAGGAVAATGGVPLVALFAPLAVAVPLLTLRNLGFGLALLPLVGVAVPLSLGTGTQSPIVAALMFAVFLMAASFARALLSRHARLVNSPVVAPALALVLVWVLAMLSSEVVRDPLVWVPPTWTLIQLGGLSVAIISAGVFLLAVHVGREVRWIQLATWSFLALGAVSILAYFAGAQNVVGNVLQTGGLFTMWVVALAYGQALFNQDLHPGVRGALLVLAAAWVGKALILQTWWLSGWLPAVIAITAITFFWSRKAFAVLLLVALIAIGVNFESVYDAVWGVNEREGGLTRLDIWAQTFDLVSHYPFLGTGPAGYAAYFQSLYKSSHFSLSTHNGYLDSLAQTGVIGLLILLWLLVAIARVGWRARGVWKSGFAGGFAHGAFGAFFGLVVAMSQGDWFIPFVYNQTIAGFRYTVHSWVFLGLLAALALMRPEQEVN